MLVGAGEIDAALLVVAADDGPRAQTLEHLALLDALGIRHGIAVVTKADVAGRGADRRGRRGDAAAARRDVARRVAGPRRVGGGRGRDRRAAGGARRAPRPSSRSRGVAGAGSRLAIDRVFAVKGRGVVVTGTLRGRSLAAAARPSVSCRATGPSASARSRSTAPRSTRADPGRTALNLAGVEADDLHRGLVLTDDPAVVASDRLLVRLAAPLPDRARARLHLGTAAVDARRRPERAGRPRPRRWDSGGDRPAGGTGSRSRAGDRFVLRRTGGTARIVGGLVLDAEPAARHLAPAPDRRAGRPPRRRPSTRLTPRPSRPPGSTSTASSRPSRAPIAVEVVAPDSSPRPRRPSSAAAGRRRGAAADRRSGGRRPRRSAAARRSRRTSVEPRRRRGLVDQLVRDGRLVRDGASVRLARHASPTAAEPGPGPGRRDGPPRSGARRRRPRRAWPTAARAAACPPDGVRALERTGRIVVLEPDLAYAATTYRDLTARPSRWPARRR